MALRTSYDTSYLEASVVLILVSRSVSTACRFRFEFRLFTRNIFNAVFRAFILNLVWEGLSRSILRWFSILTRVLNTHFLTLSRLFLNNSNETSVGIFVRVWAELEVLFEKTRKKNKKKSKRGTQRKARMFSKQSCPGGSPRGGVRQACSGWELWERSKVCQSRVARTN